VVDKIKTAGIGDKILELWDMGYSGDKIAAMTGVVTGRSILRYVNKHGRCTFDTRKDAICEHCRKEFKKVRSLYLKSKKHFCKKECYWKYLENPDYIRSAYGMRIARKAVKGCGYYLLDSEVVHHVDGNCNNNDPNNLMVFKNQSEHNLWHRNGGPDSGVIPLWP